MTSGYFAFDCTFDGASDFFADHRAHRAADESKFHRAADHGAAVDAAFGGKDGVFHAELVLRVFQALGVGLGVGEMQRIVRGEVGVEFLVLLVVEKQFEAAAGAEPEMVIALGADVPVCVEILLPDDGAAGAALRPQAFGADAALVHRRGIFDRFFFALEPGHG